MNEGADDFSLIPSELDKTRLDQIPVDGRVEAENGTWIILRYPALPFKGWRWCEYSLIVNCPHVPPAGHTYEFKFLKAALTYLEQLETLRKTNLNSET